MDKNKKKNRFQEEELFQTWRNRIGLDVKFESMGMNYSKLGRGFTEEDDFEEEIISYEQNRPLPEFEEMDDRGHPVDSFRHKINKTRKTQYDDFNLVNVVHPLRLFRPTNLNELREIVDYAGRNGFKVKAVGSGHSYSDITTTPDFLIKTDFLNAVLVDKNSRIKHFDNLKESIKSYIDDSYTSHLQQEDKLINPEEVVGKDPVDAEKFSLFEIEAGIKIRDLNKELHLKDKALIGLGTYQGQAFMGAVSTSTHGSGILLPPFPDMIVSMVLVATQKGDKDGNYKSKVYRIEPTNGITKENTSEEGVDELIQDDDKFKAALVNMGCFGIVYSVIIRVRPTFYLIEETEWVTWDKLEKVLNGDYTIPDNNPSDIAYEEPNLIKENLTKETLFYRKSRDKFGSSGKEDRLDANKKEHNPYTAIRDMIIYVNPHRVNEDGQSTKITCHSSIMNKKTYQTPNGGHYFCRILRRYKADPEEIAEIKKRAQTFNSMKHVTPELRKSVLARESGQKATGRANTNKFVEFLKKGRADNLEDLKEAVNKIPKWLNNRLIFRTEHPRGIWKILCYVNLNNLHKNYETRVKNTANATDVEKSNYLYGNLNFRVHLAGADRVGGYGAEMAFKFKEQQNGIKKYVAAINKILDTAEKAACEGLHFQTVIIAVRFVKNSQAYFSPQYSPDEKDPTVMLELLMINDTHGGKESLYRYQKELLQMGGRPHWGLEFNVLNGNNQTLQKLYGQIAYNAWLLAYRFFNQGGVFNNRFTDRMGFSELVH